MSDDDAEGFSGSVPKERSPAFPYISLDLAVERVRRIYAAIRNHPQPREVLAKAYGKPVSSSATIQTFATLLQYGLLTNTSGPQGRKMRVSDLAQTICNPHTPPDKVMEALKEAALKPVIFQELWNLYGDTVGLSDSVPLYYLTHERKQVHGANFMDKAASDVLRVYRATLSYAGISGSDSSQVLPADRNGATPPAPTEAKVGDYVLIEIDGTRIFKEPKRVEEIREHDGEKWVFVEGQKAAVKMNQVEVQTASAKGGTPPIRDLPPSDDELQEGWSEELLIDDGGDEIKIRYRGKASVDRYSFIRDYLDFKIQRLTQKEKKPT